MQSGVRFPIANEKITLNSNIFQYSVFFLFFIFSVFFSSSLIHIDTPRHIVAIDMYRPIHRFGHWLICLPQLIFWSLLGYINPNAKLTIALFNEKNYNGWRYEIFSEWSYLWDQINLSVDQMGH